MKKALGAVCVAGMLACRCSSPSKGSPPDGGSTLPDGGDPQVQVKDISASLETYRAQGNLPGITGAVFHGNTLIAIGASGVREQGNPTKVTINDQWHLGSDTKAMTATLVGIFVERGLIHWDDTLAQLFPDVSGITPYYANVTMTQLLQHRSGFPTDVPANIWNQMRSDGSSPQARNNAVTNFLTGITPDSVNDPIGTYEYSNINFILAGAALERKASKTWEQIIQDELFTPLHMDGCGFGAPGTDAGTPDQPWGHAWDGAQLIPLEPGPLADNPASLGPAGTVHCPLVSWGQFLAIHLQGAQGHDVVVNGQTLIKASTLKVLQTPPASGEPYMGGWEISTRPWAKGMTLNHIGSNTYWYADAWLAPQINTTFVVVTNRGQPDSVGTAVDNAFAPLISEFGQ